MMLESRVAHTNDLVEVVLDALGGSLGADLGAQASEVRTKLLDLKKKSQPN
jgi:hypothetical protein